MQSADVGLTRPSELRAIQDWKNHQAWFEFQRKYDPLLRSYCKSLRLDEQTTDEVCQLTWIEVARRIESFVYDPKKSFRAWLRTVCTNRARDYFKKAKRDLVLPFEERDEDVQLGRFGSFEEEAQIQTAATIKTRSLRCGGVGPRKSRPRSRRRSSRIRGRPSGCSPSEAATWRRR